MVTSRRVLPRFVAPVSVVVLVLAACGGGGNPAGPNPTPTPTVSCTQTVVVQQSGAVPLNNAVITPFTTTTSGRIDAVLDWTFADSFMGLAVHRGTCTVEQYAAGSCDLVIGLASPPKPLKGSSAVLPAGTYGLIVANASLVNESYSATVTLSSAGCPAIASRGTASRNAR